MSTPDFGSYDPTSWLDDHMAMGLRDDPDKNRDEQYDRDESDERDEYDNDTFESGGK